MQTEQNLPYVQLNQDNVPHLEIGAGSYATMPDLKKVPAHRHDFQTILWTNSGSAAHSIDNNIIHLLSHTFCLITRGQVHQIKTVSTDFEGAYIRFNDAFLPESTFGQRWSYRATLFNTPSVHNQTLTVPADEVAEVKSLLQLIMIEYSRTDFLRQRDGLGLLLQFLLLKIEHFQQRSATNLFKGDSTSYTLFKSMLTLLEENFYIQHSVRYYADALHLSPAKLTDITKQILGKSTKQVIIDRLMLEAKRLLQFTDASVKEIAFELGYSSPFHFSRAFKNQTNASP